MYFLYDLAQFRPNQPVHLLQEQLWHSLSSPPQKMPTKIDPQTPFSPVKRSQNIRKSQVLVAKSHEAKIQQSLQLHH